MFPVPPNGPFPFTVSHPATGNWCAQTEVATTGAYAGRTGAIFQPSILAGDAYKLRVAAVYADYVDPSAVHGTFDTQMSAMPDELAVKFGTFQVWRSLEHSMYAVELPGLPKADLEGFSDRFAKLYFRVRHTPIQSTQYFNIVEQIYSGAIPTAGFLEHHVQLALEDDPNIYGARAFGVYFKSWDRWKAAMIQHHGTLRAAYDFDKAHAHPALNHWRKDDQVDGPYPLLEPWPATYIFHAAPPEGDIKISIVGQRHNGPLESYSTRVNNVGEISAKIKDGWGGKAMDLKAYTQGTDANLTVDIHCAHEQREGVRAQLEHDFVEVWDSMSVTQYKAACSRAWGFPVTSIVNNHLVTQNDGLRTAQFAEGKYHDGWSPAGKALFANAQRASLDVFIFKDTGVFTTLIHEAGHALFINHPYWDINQANNDPRHLHDAATRHCTMTTPSKGHNYCGFCMLRLRGWSIYKLDAARPRPRRGAHRARPARAHPHRGGHRPLSATSSRNALDERAPQTRSMPLSGSPYATAS